MDERLKQYEDKMQKSLQNLLEEFGSIRAGRANPHVLDKIKVDYYGTPTGLQQVANISVRAAYDTDTAMGSKHGAGNRKSDYEL